MNRFKLAAMASGLSMLLNACSSQHELAPPLTAEPLPSSKSESLHVFAPDSGVICDTNNSEFLPAVELCIDSFGVSVALTEIYLGEIAADRLVKAIAARGSKSDLSQVMLSDKVICESNIKACYIDRGDPQYGEIAPVHNQILYVSDKKDRTLDALPAEFVVGAVYGLSSKECNDMGSTTSVDGDGLEFCSLGEASAVYVCGTGRAIVTLLTTSSGVDMLLHSDGQWSSIESQVKDHTGSVTYSTEHYSLKISRDNIQLLSAEGGIDCYAAK